MKLLFIFLALFSYDSLFITSEVKCENNEIQIQYDNAWYNIILFNISVDENIDVCTYLEDAQVSIEFEQLIDIANPYNAYVFIDGELLQQILIDEGVATIRLHNPYYKYELQEKEKLIEVIAKEELTQTYESRKTAIYIIIAWIAIILIMFLFNKMF